MTDYYTPSKTVNIWDKYSIRPGAVGSVGDTMPSVRLKQSSPEMTPKYQKWNSGRLESYYGSNVQDGRKASFMNGGLGARTISRPLPYRSSNRKSFGWVHQDIVPTERERETKVAALPQFGWKAQVANVLRAKVTGDSFLPVPGGYTMQGVPRGSQYPRVVDSSAGNGIAATVPNLDPRFPPEKMPEQPHGFPQATRRAIIGDALARRGAQQIAGRG